MPIRYKQRFYFTASFTATFSTTCEFRYLIMAAGSKRGNLEKVGFWIFIYDNMLINIKEKSELSAVEQLLYIF